MNIYRQICSHCHDDFWHCRCDTFHPPIEVKEQVLDLSVEEASALIKYFHNSAGYISHEFDPLIHDIIKRLDAFLGNIQG